MLALLPLLLLIGCSTPTLDEPAIMPPASQAWLYLLIGQSNMAGRAPLDSEAFKTHPRVAVMTEKGWMLATDPLHHDKSYAGVGPGLSFGKTIANQHHDITVGLIPAAVGGTSIAEWQKGGELYTHAVAITKRAMRDGTLKGILWHQGEQDASMKTPPIEYARLLRQLFVDLHADLGPVPVVLGDLPTFLTIPHDALNSVIRSSGFPVASVSGLHDMGDSLHLDTASQREFGRRYAMALAQ